MQIFDPKNIIRVSILAWVIASIFILDNFSVRAQKTSLLQIQNHALVLFNLDSDIASARLYASWKLKVSVTWNSEVKIVERDSALVVWSPHGVQDLTWAIKIVSGKKSFNTPFYINIEQSNSPLDYDIFKTMFQTSLQKKSLSCESSASADIISWFNNSHTSEDTIIDLLPKNQYFDALPEQLNDGSLLWWNPDLGFVGYIDSSPDLKASQSLLTWYGVYEKPIAEAYNRLWFETLIINKNKLGNTVSPSQHLNYLLKRLQAWDMVQLWWDWCTKTQYEDGVIKSKHELDQQQANKKIGAKNECWNVDKDRSLSWKYQDSSWNLIEHTGLNGQHAFILLWWKWNIKNPTHIRVWDTDTGYHEYQTIEWMRKWEAMGYRSVVVSK